MGAPLTITFTLTPQRYQDVLVQLGRRASSPWPTFFITWIVVTLLARWLLSLQIMSSWTLSAQFGAAAAFATAVSGYFTYQARKQASKFEAIEVTYLFSEHGVEKRTPHSEAKMEWKAFKKFRETEGFFFLYYSDEIADVVLKSAFASPKEAASFRHFLTGRLPCEAKPVPSQSGLLLLTVLIAVAVMMVIISKQFPSRKRHDPPREVPANSRDY